MTKLIDADALLAKLYSNFECLSKAETIAHIENAPTVQREGWVRLSDEQIGEVLDAWESDEKLDFANDYARAIEAKLKQLNEPEKG